MLPDPSMAPSDVSFSSRDIAMLSAMLLTLGAVLAALVRFRKGLVDEVRTQLQAGSTPSPVSISPNPLQVQEAVQFTPLAAHEQLTERVEGIRQEVQDRFAEAARASAESRGRIYDLIRENNTKTAGLQAKVEELSPRIVQLDGKIDRILERMPRKP